MEDKVFNLLEKMYSELTGKIDSIDGKIASLNDEVKEIKSDVNTLEKQVTKIDFSIENEIKPKINLCLDELISVKEKQIEHDQIFTSIESKIESHDVEISVIKRVK